MYMSVAGCVSLVTCHCAADFGTSVSASKQYHIPQAAASKLLQLAFLVIHSMAHLHHLKTRITGKHSTWRSQHTVQQEGRAKAGGSPDEGRAKAGGSPDEVEKVWLGMWGTFCESSLDPSICCVLLCLACIRSVSASGICCHSDAASGSTHSSVCHVCAVQAGIAAI